MQDIRKTLLTSEESIVRTVIL